MPVRDKLDLSQKNILDVVVSYRWWLVAIIIVITVALSAQLRHLQTDPSLKSGIDETSHAYHEYQRYLALFGNEERLLIVIRHNEGARDPRLLSALATITNEVEKQDKVAEVVSLANLRVFQVRKGLYGTFPIFRYVNGEPRLPDKEDLENIRKALPVTDFLLSPDLKTVGVLVRVQDRWRLDPEALKPLLANIDTIVKKALPTGSEFRIIGAAIIREAIVRYSIQTGIVFGVLCMLIATVVTVYIFKSLRVTAITNVILGTCVLWIFGLMSLARIPLNSTTVLSFGFVPIVTLEIVIHMVVRYHQFHETVRDKIGAIKQAVRWLARPCFICVATTAVGFGTLMISSIPMVRQLGFIMSLGVLIAYGLAMILTPAFFSVMKSLDAPSYSGMLQDWLNLRLQRIEKSIFRRHRFYVALGAVVAIFLFAGAPMIHSDVQVARMLSGSTREIKDLKFAEQNLTPVNTLELMLEANPGAFKKAEIWKKVAELEKRLRDIPEVASTDSLLPLLEYLDGLMGSGAEPQKDIFAKPDVIPQLLTVTSLTSEGKRAIRRFVDEGYGRLRISVRIKDSPGVPISNTIEQIQRTADAVMNGWARPTVTGDLTVFASQQSALIKDQIESMAIAAVLITLIMMLQMGSPMLGLISLIPNVPPVAAVFGVMGWFGISLDGVTVFAATVAVGLAVDNTIHYLTQLKRDMTLNQGTTIEECVRRAYRLTAKQIASWSSVTLMGFLALAVSPFKPVVLFGILGCSALCLGLFGDLIFIQSLILSSPAIRSTIDKLIAKEIRAQTIPADYRHDEA